MAESNQTGNGSAKAFASIMAVGVIATAIFAAWSPTNENVAVLTENMKEVKRGVADATIGRLEAQIVHLKETVGAAKELGKLQAVVEGFSSKLTLLAEEARDLETQERHTHRLLQIIWQKLYSDPLPADPSRTDGNSNSAQ